MDNRLKLYDDLIYTYLSHKDKIKFKKIAYNNKKTISEFNRSIIQLVIKLDELGKLDYSVNNKEKELYKLIDSLGGMLDRR